jgi:hypothetical protein
MKSRTLLIFLFFLMALAGCKTAVPDNSEITRYGETNNIDYPYLEIQDTAYVHGMQIMFLFAKDTISHINIDIVKTKNGVFVLRDKRIGISRYLNEHSMEHEYFKLNDGEKKFELYSKIATGINNQLQTILNTAAMSSNKPFSRQELDSFFRYFLFGRDGFHEMIVLYDTLPSKTGLIDISLTNLSRNLNEKCDSLNKQYLIDFYNYLKRNIGSDNFFIYSSISGGSGSGYFSIRINEEFNSDSSAQKFYERYFHEGYMYSVKSYFPYYIIEEGGY